MVSAYLQTTVRKLMTSNASQVPGRDSHGVEDRNVLVPSPASLAAQYKHWLENSIVQQFRDKYNQADARLDLVALGAAASKVIGSPCTNTYKVSQGKSTSDISSRSDPNLRCLGGYNQVRYIVCVTP